MKTHLAWIRFTAAAVIVAGAGVQQAAAQYPPYRPIPPQPAASAAAPQQSALPQAAQPVYTAYRPQYEASAGYQPMPTTAYPTTPGYPTAAAYPTTASYPTMPVAAQYGQPASAYPQYPQTAAQYPTTIGAYSYVAQQPTETLPTPKPMSTSAAQPAGGAGMNAAPANAGMPAAASTSAAQPGCGCNGVAAYGARDFYNTTGCGCQSSTGYPSECGIGNFFGDSGPNENQWFGGVYFLAMGRTNETPQKLTVQVDHSVASDPYYPQAADTIMDTHDVNFDFREGVEVRFGSTFTIGEPCGASPSGCNGYGYGYGNGCGGSGCCAPATMYAWEFAWWGINSNDNTTTVEAPADVASPIRIYGMKNFIGLQYDRDGGGVTFRPVNDYYGYQLPIPAPALVPQDGDIRVLAQYVRSDFQAQNLELNFIRFPMCNTCAGGGCDAGGCGAGGCGSNYTGCNGCDNGCGSGLGFSMYGSCGVRYFHIHDYLSYGTEFGQWDSSLNAGAGDYDQPTYNGFTGDNSNELVYNIDVKNNLLGPQLGWTNDYCWGKWNLFLNSTFGIFDNHISSNQRMSSGGGGTITFAGDGSTFNVSSSKDQVSFLGELRAGVAYDLTCHWRGVVAYRAVAITGLATANDQMQNDYTNRESVQIINSDNSTIIHGAQVGAECRY